MNPIKRIETFGQAVWLDHYDHELLRGKLQRHISEDGLKGLTSNPAILAKALPPLAQRDEVRARAQDLSSAKALYEALALDELGAAADQFRPLFDSTDGWHGWVSLEVDPRLAFDARATVAEAARLFSELGRPNVFVKVPATREGLMAITQLTEQGVNVNVTLVFSVPRYLEVANAFMTGLERRASKGLSLSNIRSVASFFLSRIDAAVDPELEAIAKAGGSTAGAAQQLLGSIALASAKLAYDGYLELCAGGRWSALSARGARPQWLLWGSTGTKNPNYDALKYVEALIGPETITTIPPETLEVYRKRGNPATRVHEGVERARIAFEQLAQVGIDIERVTQKLESEGVEKFAKPFDGLLRTLECFVTAA
ncbi:MAG TPA: transaldolase [Polyangiaceae bacterium]